MCGRYSLNIGLQNLMKRYGIIDTDINFSPAEEIYPSGNVPVVLKNNKRQLELFKWGFDPSFARNLIINARVETIDEKNLFKDCFYNNRCLIPATAFFEWKDIDGKKIKYKISLPESDIFSFAGIYDTFTDKHNNPVQSFTIITTAACEKIKPVHHRMPVILKENQEDLWLDSEIKDSERLKKLLESTESEDINLEKTGNKGNQQSLF